MLNENTLTEELQALHNSIARCLKADDETPPGIMKIYGVRELPDWKELLERIEILLTRRGVSFTPILLNVSGTQQRPIPSAAVLYERIKECLAYEDQLPAGVEKPYGVRLYKDWREQASQLEEFLNECQYEYSKIIW